MYFSRKLYHFLNLKELAANTLNLIWSHTSAVYSAPTCQLNEHGKCRAWSQQRKVEGPQGTACAESVHFFNTADLPFLTKPYCIFTFEIIIITICSFYKFKLFAILNITKPSSNITEVNI